MEDSEEKILLMHKIRALPLMSAVALFAVLPASHSILAQEPGPPPMGGPPPAMDVDKQLSSMTKHYALSDAQKTQIRPILADAKKQMDALFQNTSLAPEDQFAAMRRIHDDEVSKISAILNDNQRAKYQKDQERMMHEPPGDPGPPPDGGGGPPLPAQNL